MPNINNKLASMLPRRLACTMRTSSLTKAMTKMMSSTALPKVMFIRAPTAGPRLAAMVSVAMLRSPASGMIAMAFMVNMTGPFMDGMFPSTMPTGTKSRRTLM